MKNLYLFIAFVCFFSCKPDEKPVPSHIQIDGSSWEYTDAIALVRNGGFPGRFDFKLKINGADGSFLYIILPREQFSAMPALPYQAQCEFYLYSDATINARVFIGQGNMELFKFDDAGNEMSVRFGGSISHKGETREITDAEMNGIKFNKVTGLSTGWGYDISKNQAFLDASPVSKMDRGQNDCTFHFKELTQDKELRFDIPWGLALGKHFITAADSSVFRYYLSSINPDEKAVFESGWINLEKNSLSEAKQSGAFEVIFHDPNDPIQKTEFASSKFSVEYY